MTQWQGEHYRDIAKPQRSLASGTLSNLFIEGHERVLDVGCGDGTITMQLADRISPPGGVVGIDPSPSMIAGARKLGANRPNVDFNDVLDAYESVIGTPGIFRFLQIRIYAERRQR